MCKRLAFSISSTCALAVAHCSANWLLLCAVETSTETECGAGMSVAHVMRDRETATGTTRVSESGANAATASAAALTLTLSCRLTSLKSGKACLEVFLATPSLVPLHAMIV